MEVPMWRFFAGAAACFLLLTGAFLLWQSRAQGPGLPGAPAARAAGAPFFSASQPLEAPEASAKTREEKRFSRADKNKDGKIAADEYFAGRRRFFDKLDIDHSGTLTFQEYAAKAIDKFKGADGDHNGWLSAAEFATTAAPAGKRRSNSCSCGRPMPAPAAETNTNDE
jgi:hypothetical protein